MALGVDKELCKTEWLFDTINWGKSFGQNSEKDIKQKQLEVRIYFYKNLNNAKP